MKGGRDSKKRRSSVKIFGRSARVWSFDAIPKAKLLTLSGISGTQELRKLRRILREFLLEGGLAGTFLKPMGVTRGVKAPQAGATAGAQVGASLGTPVRSARPSRKRIQNDRGIRRP